MSASSLEKRIASALVDEAFASVELSALLTEVEGAITAADKAANEARTEALDPLLSPDPNKARTALEDAEFRCARLKSLLPRLQQRYQKVAAHEEYAHWLPRFEAANAKQATLAARMRELYVPFVEQMVPLLLEIEKADAEARRINDEKPSAGCGDGRQLITTELLARGLSGLGQYGLSILKDLKLPSWGLAGRPAWPPYRPIDLAMITPRPGGDPRLHSSRWYEVWEEEQQRRTRSAAE